MKPKTSASRGKPTKRTDRESLLGSLRSPSFTEERLFREQGYRYIAGVDEVGRGALAGPVVAGAVILPSGFKSPWLGEVRDSKQLTPARREYLSQHIYESALATGIGSADCRIVDARGIISATRLAMKLAIEQLIPRAEALLVDYLSLPQVRLPQKGIKFGDSLSYSIACASIIAKVYRDSMMREMDGDYPDYGFARNKGYGTEEHLECLSRVGPSPVHRQTFRPIRIMFQSLL